jgi:type IV pilus assembly protein PilN
MIRINLLAVREVEEAASRRKEFILAGGGITIAFLVALLSYLSQGLVLRSINADIEKLEGNIAKIRKQNQEVQKMERQKTDLQSKLQVVRLLTFPGRRAASVHILDDLSASTPEFLWLTDFSEVKGAAKINGRAVDNQTIAAFAHDLAQSKYFQKVEIRETAQEETTSANPRARGPRGQLQPIDVPGLASVKRFLIEAYINYLPSVEKQEGAPESHQGEPSPKNVGGAPANHP